MAQNQSVPAAFRDPVVVPGMELETAADIFEPNKIDVAKLAAEDIAIQRGEQEQNLRQDFDKLLNAQSNQEIEQLGITELGGTPISMNVLSAARENADLQGQLYASFYNSKE
ncbi:MAG: hypothetical protein CM15mV47_370 [uncultured marine virus]|nr:MAG: hypothetical protein CM15mV47_370 [uncultured marine virus]